MNSDPNRELPKDRPIRIGILGGGQLAQMLAEAAPKLAPEFELEIHAIVETSGEIPAERAGALPIRMPKGFREGYHRVFQKLDLVLLENEFVDCNLLEASARATKVLIEPPLAAVRIFQDKLKQKELLAKLGIPTSPWLTWDMEEQSPAEWLETAFARLGDKLVLKWARMGYDGKGVHFVSRGMPLEATTAFAHDALDLGVPVYAEARVDFAREVAIAASYSVTGEFAAYPLVVSEQDHGICDRVSGPAVALGAPSSLEAQAREFAERLARESSLHGTFAIEMFETRDGALCVNEIAPRVHNSAHYTQDASKTSQFENHLRATLGLPLGSTECAPAFAMLNLLGPDGVERLDGANAPTLELPEGAWLHWYGKSGIQPRRKLGHVNARADSAAELPALLARLEKARDAWKTSLKSQGTVS